MELSVRKEIGNRKIEGHYREIEPTVTRGTKDGDKRVLYGYRETGGRFERVDLSFVLTAASFAKGGAVPLGRIAWSALEEGDGVYGRLLSRSHIASLQEAFHPSDAEMEDFVLHANAEIERCIRQFREAYHQSEEYRTFRLNRDRIYRWKRAKNRFDAAYGTGWFEQIYNFNLELMNVDLLEKLRHSRASGAEDGGRKSGGSDPGGKQDSRSQDPQGKNPRFSTHEITYLKKFYKSLARQYHPDISHDNGEAMQLLNRLKDFFGL